MQARRVRELACTGKFFAGPSWHRPVASSTSSSRRRRLVARISGTVADYANPRAARRRSGFWMQYRNRPDHVTRDRCYRGPNGLQPVSFDASLNHPVNHRHIVAGRCITSDTTRPAMSAARRERAPWGLPQMSPNLQINNGFRHQETAATNRRRRRVRDSSDENGAVHHG